MCAFATRQLCYRGVLDFRCPNRSFCKAKSWASKSFFCPVRRPARWPGSRSGGEELLAGRAQWITLLCEALPRALLAELGLARILLGSSGGGQFLVVLPGDARAPPRNSCKARARHIDRLSSGHLQLLWSVTENLGDWSVVRKRLNEELQRWPATPAGRPPARKPFCLHSAAAGRRRRLFFAAARARKCARPATVGWSPETPGAWWSAGDRASIPGT